MGFQSLKCAILSIFSLSSQQQQIYRARLVHKLRRPAVQTKQKHPAIAGCIVPIKNSVDYLPWRSLEPTARKISLICFSVIIGVAEDLARPVLLWKLLIKSTNSADAEIS